MNKVVNRLQQKQCCNRSGGRAWKLHWGQRSWWLWEVGGTLNCIGCGGLSDFWWEWWCYIWWEQSWHHHQQSWHWGKEGQLREGASPGPSWRCLQKKWWPGQQNHRWRPCRGWRSCWAPCHQRSQTQAWRYRGYESLWNPRPVEIPGHPRGNSFFLVFQAVDKEKPNQAFFPVICLGIFLPVYQGQFTGPTNPWFQLGFFSLCCNQEFFSLVFQAVNKEKPVQAFFPVFYLGIFWPSCWGYLASVTNAWFQPGLFSVL